MSKEPVTPSNLKILIRSVFVNVKGVDEKKVWALLRDLSPRQHDVLWLRFGLGDGQVHRTQEIAKALGLRKETIGHCFGQTVRRLRHPARLKELLKASRGAENNEQIV